MQLAQPNEQPLLWASQLAFYLPQGARLSLYREMGHETTMPLTVRGFPIPESSVLSFLHSHAAEVKMFVPCQKQRVAPESVVLDAPAPEYPTRSLTAERDA